MRRHRLRFSAVRIEALDPKALIAVPGGRKVQMRTVGGTRRASDPSPRRCHSSAEGPLPLGKRVT